MADVSKIQLPDNTVLNIKDSRISDVGTFVQKSGGTMDADAELEFVDTDEEYWTSIYPGELQTGGQNTSVAIDGRGFIQVSDNRNNGYKYSELYADKIQVAVDAQNIYDQTFPAKSGTFAMTSDISVTDVTVGGSSVVSSGTAVIPAIPSAPGTLNTTATTAQSTSASEALSGSITLHKVAKTGTYSDLIGTPTIPDTSTLLPKSGGTMEDDATLTFADSNDYYATVISPSGLSIADTDDSSYVILDPTESGLIIQNAASSPTDMTSYSMGYITNKLNGASATFDFPTSSGTLALTSDIPTIHTGTSDPSSNLGNNGDIYLKLSS